MELTINDNNKINDKFLLVLIIGILNSIKEKVISIDEAEKILFLPGYVDDLKRIGIDKQIVKVVEFCCELEDISDIVPEKFETELKKIIDMAINLLKQYPEEKKRILVINKVPTLMESHDLFVGFCK